MERLRSIVVSAGVFAQTYRHLRMSQRRPARIEQLKGRWAREILNLLEIDLEIRGRPTVDSSTIFVGNHISYLDIPVLIASVREISFVAKQELERWPIFGRAAEAIGTVFVQRESARSRSSAGVAVAEAVQRGARVVIFPSGTTCLGETKRWRKGAFHIANQLGSRIQPFRITYTPLRKAAYIDRDFFPIHLLKLSSCPGIKVKIEFHEPVDVTDPLEDSVRWHNWTKSKNLGVDGEEVHQV